MESQLKFRETDAEDDVRPYFVEVALPLAVANTFTYRVPLVMQGKVAIGQRVVVQFGKNKIYTAIIVDIHRNIPEKYSAKLIIDIIDNKPIVSPLHLEFWKWIAAYYCCTLGEVMDAALPGNMKMQSETQITINETASHTAWEISPKEQVILDALAIQKTLTIGEIAELLKQKAVLVHIKSLYEKGFIFLKEELTDEYHPKKEWFVSPLFDPGDKEFIKELFEILEPAPRQSDILLTYLQIYGKQRHISRKALLKQAHATHQALDSLVTKGIFAVFEEDVDRLAVEDFDLKSSTLNDEQAKALEEINEAFEQKNVALLHGVTGSGKTHLYMSLIDKVIAEGRQALYLVPEIALTAQLIQRLRTYYGGSIGIYHSKFNPNERVEVWNKVISGEYKIVLGVRSALFLPFNDLGLMVIDEEHENTYKQYDPAPRYHARDAGIYLMGMFKGKTILGTATPSFESYFNAERDKYALINLSNRWGNVRMPEMVLADLQDEIKKKKMKSHFSSLLFTEMQRTLKTGLQTILFQNRRGYAPILECQTCGWAPSCINCDITLTYHQEYRQVICHYCGYKEDTPKKCGNCGNFTLKMLGFGTEKIEDELHIFFPEYKTLRLDQDTTRTRNAYTKIIQAFEDGEAQILVGTQMVTKGLDFEKVNIVGILNADQMLKYPDFRAVERSYQLMSQVSGRAGRRDLLGKVIIQTYNTGHLLFQYLLAHNYDGFYKAFIQERLEFHYPPFTKLIKLSIKDANKDKVSEAAHWLADRLRDIFGSRVLGPEFPPVARIRGKYMMNIMLKFERHNLNMEGAKKEIMTEISQFKSNKDFKKMQIIVDVDPY